VGSYLEPDKVLPPNPFARAFLFLLLLLVMAVPVHVAYKFRTFLEEVPDVDRTRIYDLRALAGRAVVLYAPPALIPPPPRTNKPLEELREVGSRLRHYPDLYRASGRLVGILWAMSPATNTTATAREWPEFVRDAQGAYERLVDECDALLRRPVGPPPTTAGE